MKKTIEILTQQGNLPLQNKPHKLSGNYSNLWEAHISSNWLIIWEVDIENKVIILYRTGTHSDLFR